MPNQLDHLTKLTHHRTGDPLFVDLHRAISIVHWPAETIAGLSTPARTTIKHERGECYVKESPAEIMAIAEAKAEPVPDSNLLGELIDAGKLVRSFLGNAANVGTPLYSAIHRLSDVLEKIEGIQS